MWVLDFRCFPSSQHQVTEEVCIYFEKDEDDDIEDEDDDDDDDDDVEVVVVDDRNTHEVEVSETADRTTSSVTWVVP